MANTRWDATIAALQAETGMVSGEVAMVAGYAAAGDGGGGSFVFASTSPAGRRVTGATNATPIVITTSAPHGLTSGQRVMIGGVAGNTAANGAWTISVQTATTFSLTASTGNGAYTTGGSVGDSGSTIPSTSATTGLWTRIATELSVAYFGAVGDYDPTTGTGTDNRVAFLTAAASASASGGDLYVPPGNYKLGSYVPIVGAVKLRIHGTTLSSIFYPSDNLALVPDATAVSPAQVRSAFLVKNSRDVAFENLEFVGGSSPELTNQNVGCGIYATRCVGMRMISCKARDGASLFVQDTQADSTSAGGNTLAVSGSVVTLTSSNGGIHAAMAGRFVTITNATNPINNGVYFVLSASPTSNTVTYLNGSAVAENPSPLIWTVNDGDEDSKLVNCRLDGCRAASYTGRGGAYLNCTFQRPMTQDLAGVPDSFSVVGGVVTLTDATAPWTPALVGSLIKIQGATSALNNDTFVITSATARTVALPATLTYVNANGVSESAPRLTAAWWIPGGERSGRGNGAGAISNASGLGVVTFTAAAASAVFRPDDVGKTLRLTDATHAVNNGNKVITRYISSTQIQYVQSGAVSDSYADVFTVDGYDNTKCDSVVGPAISSTSTSVGANTLTDTGQAMVANAYAGRILIDSTGRMWSVTSNTATAFTLNAGGATPASGAYAVGAAATYGSSHGIYYFAGRSRVNIENCTFRGIRTIGVKVSGSSLPIEDIEVHDCVFEACGAAIVAGADDSQDHQNFNFHDNQIIDCATGRQGWNEQVAFEVLGARNVRICNNQFHATHDNVQALINGGAISGYFGIFAARFAAGISQPLEDVLIDGNTFTADPNATSGVRIAEAAIHCERVGQRAYWRTGGSLAKQTTGAISLTISTAATGSVTRGSGSWVTDGCYVGGTITMSGFTNPGNNTTKTIASVTATVVTFTSNTGLVNETRTASATNNVMTLSDPAAAFTQALTGWSLQICFAPDAGNNCPNNSALETRVSDFSVLAVNSTSSLSFVNPAGVGGDVSAGTYRIKPLPGYATRGGACQISRNNFSGYGSVAIELVGCTAPQVVDNVFNGMASGVADSGSVAPHIARNIELQAGSNAARITLTSSTAWPIVHDNFITNGALAGGILSSELSTGATRSDMGVGVDSSTAIAHPLLGKQGRCRSTGARPEIVFAFGSDLVDGDTIALSGEVYTYKSASPGTGQFNSIATLTSLVASGHTGFTVEDYGTGLSGAPITGHIRVHSVNPSSTANLGYIDTINVLNPTALVILRNNTAGLTGGGNESIAYSRGEGVAYDSGALALTINATAGTITRSAGSWLTDGLAANMTITTSGFSNGGNNTTKTIASVTATVITVTDNSMYVNETGSGTQHVTAALPRRFLVWSPCMTVKAPALQPDNAAAAALAASGWYPEKDTNNAGSNMPMRTVTTLLGTEEMSWRI